MASDKSLEQKLHALSQQNGRLSVLLEEKRRDTKVLEEKVSQLEEREQNYEQTLLSVNRVWDQVNQDINTVCLTTDTGLLDRGSVIARGSSSTSGIDPFLRRLLHEADPSSLKAAQDAYKKMEFSDVESALLQRARSTKEALAAMLGQVQALREKQSSSATAMAALAPDAALRDESNRLVTEVAGLRRQLDASRAMQRTVTEQLHVLEGHHLEQEESLRKTQNELGDKEQELSNVQRKYFAIKNDGGSAGAASAAAAAAALTAGSHVKDAAGVKAAQDDAVYELHDLQELLTRRNEELDSEKEQHLRTQRELQDALARVSDESWVTSSRTYQQTLQEIQRLNEHLASKAKELEGLSRERDEAQRDSHIKTQYYHAEVISRQKLAAADKMYRELQAAKAEGDRARQDLELALQREREKMGHSKTVGELRTLISTLQAQVAHHQQHDKLNKVAVERLDASAREVQECRGRLESKDLEIQRLNDKLRRKDTDLEEQRRREQGLKDRINDLKAFVDVLTVYCNDPRDAAEVRAAEAALREQVAHLKSQLEGHELQHRIRDLEAAERAAKDQTDLVGIEADSLRLEISNWRHQAAEIQAQLAAARSECDLYISEIETTGTAYEDMQSQNARLLVQLMEKDEAINQYMSDRIRLAQSQQQLAEQLDAARADAERLVKDQADLLMLKEVSDKEVAKLAAEFSMAKEQMRAHAARVEALSQELRKRDDGTAALQAQLDSLQKQVSESRGQVDEATDKHLKEKAKKQRLEDENKMLLSKVERLRKTQTLGGVAKEMQEEIDAMRSLLNCNVCHERQKNIIITKCCHVFCDKCIKRTMESRNRKCPGCGVPFAQQDVKSFFFT